MSADLHLALWTIGVGAVVSIMCALVGIWLVLQRISMIGDAISHSVLPGLAGAFIIAGSRAPLMMFVGAAIAGVLTAVLTKVIAKVSRSKEDASMGVVFTVLFALGVVMITRVAAQVDLDPGCVLYGLIEFVALDTHLLRGLEVPRAMLIALPTLGLTAAFLIAFHKELTIMAFDANLAATLGKRPGFIYYALMTMVALVTVASFEAVGSILVVAMIIAPAATAQLLTRRLNMMFPIAIFCALASSVFGYILAAYWNTSVAGMMAVVAGVLYALAVMFSPAGGTLLRAPAIVLKEEAR